MASVLKKLQKATFTFTFLLVQRLSDHQLKCYWLTLEGVASDVQDKVHSQQSSLTGHKKYIVVIVHMPVICVIRHLLTSVAW